MRRRLSPRATPTSSSSACASCARPEPRRSCRDAAVTVVVPTADRPAQLAGCLRALAALDHPRERLRGRRRRRRQRRRPRAGVRRRAVPVVLVRRERGGPGAARNTGARAADGDVLAFTDDDCRPDPGLAARAARGRRRPGRRGRRADRQRARATTLRRREPAHPGPRLRALQPRPGARRGSSRRTTSRVPRADFLGARRVRRGRVPVRQRGPRPLRPLARRPGRTLRYAADAVVRHAHALDLRAFVAPARRVRPRRRALPRARAAGAARAGCATRRASTATRRCGWRPRGCGRAAARRGSPRCSRSGRPRTPPGTPPSGAAVGPPGRVADSGVVTRRPRRAEAAGASAAAGLADAAHGGRRRSRARARARAARALGIRGRAATRWRRSVLAAASIVLAAEVLSLVDALSRGPWLAFQALAHRRRASAAAWRTGHRPPGSRSAGARRLHIAARAHPAIAFLVGAAALAMLLQAVSAVLVAPDNWDAMTYHLSKAAYWLQYDSATQYVGGSWHQLYSPPNAEMLQAWTMEMFGRDRFTQLVQWSAGVACGLVVYEGAREVGARREHAAVRGSAVRRASPAVAAELQRPERSGDGRVRRRRGAVRRAGAAARRRPARSWSAASPPAWRPGRRAARSSSPRASRSSSSWCCCAAARRAGPW